MRSLRLAYETSSIRRACSNYQRTLSSTALAMPNNARRLHDMARSGHRIGGNTITLPPKLNLSKSAMCERASVRIYLESIAGRFRWRGSGRVSRMLCEGRSQVFLPYGTKINAQINSVIAPISSCNLPHYFDSNAHIGQWNKRGPRLICYSQFGYRV